MALGSGFVLGTATASYQVEGAAAEGGRTPSIWDTFSHTPGHVLNGDTGDIACDEYHRWHEDVDLIARMGLDSYRFSISWSRVMPHGAAPVNPEGISYYRSLCQALHERGIRTVATLYHWDLPQELENRGGWTRRETAEAFADYARTMARELGDVVDVWSTLNEPWCSAFLGYASGVHAPGLNNSADALAAAHHLNLAHGLASRALREELGEDVPICLTLNLHVIRPASDSAEDLRAARRVQLVGNEVFLQPVLDGVLPDELVDLTRDITDWSFVHEGDLDLCHEVPTILGINYYSTNVVAAAAPDSASGSGGHGESGYSPWTGCDDVDFLPVTGETTQMGWNIDPTGLTELFDMITSRWPGLDMMVTENGAAFDDVVCPSGRVHDGRRIDYLRSHLSAVQAAVDAGNRLHGYYLWSLLDNFEWAFGYSKTFGIVRVEREDQRRVVKDSAKWYALLARTRDLGAADRAWAVREPCTCGQG